MRNISHKSQRENKNTHFMFDKVFPKIVHCMRKCDKIWYSQTGKFTTERMRFARWITKVTDIHSEYVILTAFPWQQWLRERSSTLRYTHIACLLKYQFVTAFCHFLLQFQVVRFLNLK
jgi:hypothetical protein